MGNNFSEKVRNMVCLICGCDPWFEFKNKMKITTHEECSCECHRSKCCPCFRCWISYLEVNSWKE